LGTESIAAIAYFKTRSAMIQTKLLLTFMLLQAFGMVARTQQRRNPKQLKKKAPDVAVSMQS